MSEPFYAISFLVQKASMIDYYISDEFHGYSVIKDDPAFKLIRKFLYLIMTKFILMYNIQLNVINNTNQHELSLSLCYALPCATNLI